MERRLNSFLNVKFQFSVVNVLLDINLIQIVPARLALSITPPQTATMPLAVGVINISA